MSTCNNNSYNQAAYNSISTNRHSKRAVRGQCNTSSPSCCAMQLFGLSTTNNQLTNTNTNTNTNNNNTDTGGGVSISSTSTSNTIELYFSNISSYNSLYITGKSVYIYTYDDVSEKWKQYKYFNEYDNYINIITNNNTFPGLKIQGSISRFGGNPGTSYIPPTKTVYMYLYSNILLDNAFYNFNNLTSVSITGSKYITSAIGLFQNASSFNQDISSWDISNVIDMTNFMVNTKFSKENYNKLLEKWSALNVKSNVKMNIGSTKYDFNYNKYKDMLTIDKSWTITDGGQIYPNLIQLNFPTTMEYKYLFVGGEYISIYLLNEDDTFYEYITNSTYNVTNSITINSTFNFKGIKIEGTITGFGGIPGTGYYSPTSSVYMYLYTNISLDNAFYNFNKLTSVTITSTKYITSAIRMFFYASIFNQDISSWDISNVIDMTDMLSFTSFSTQNYNILLEKWSALKLKSNVKLGIGSTKYSSDYQSYRDILTNTYYWSIIDGGKSDLQTMIQLNFELLTDYPYLYIGGESIEIQLYYFDSWNSNNTAYYGHWHTYSTDQTYDITNQINISVDNPFGGIKILGIIREFGGIPNVIDSYSPTTSAVIQLMNYISMDYGFYNFNKLITISGTDSVSIEEGTKYIISAKSMFQNASSFNQDISNWNISSVTDMTNMLDNSLICQNYYNQLLKKWSSLSVIPNITFGANVLNYTVDYLQYRDILNNNFNWEITDSGINSNIKLYFVYANNSFTFEFNMYIGGTNISIYVTNDTGESNNEQWKLYGYYTTLSVVNQFKLKAESGFKGIQIIGNITDYGGSYSNFSTPQSVIMNLYNNISLVYACYTYINLTSIKIKNSNYITNMRGMFFGAEIFNQLFDSTKMNQSEHISGWDTSNVTDMSYLFYYATSFNQDIGSWVTSNVKYMNHMFGIIPYFGIPDNVIPTIFNKYIGNWDTSKVIDMSYMFAGNNKFNQDISNWDTSQVTNMSYMFNLSSAYNNASKPLNWDTSAVTNMSNMFQQANVFNQDISNFNTSAVTNMSYLFSDTYYFNNNYKPLNWNTSAVTNMSYMFYNARAFNQYIKDWDISAVTNIIYMFSGAIVFNQDISSWKLNSNLKNLSCMFQNAYAFNQNISQNNNSWDTVNIDNMSFMFQNATSFNNGSNDPISNPKPLIWNTVNVKNIQNMFDGASVFNQDISSWNTSNITNMNSTFKNTLAFNQYIGNWNTINVSDICYIFNNASVFNNGSTESNKPLNWNTSKITNMSWMFNNSKSFNQNLDSWDTSKVTTMNNMFNGANNFNGNVSNWNISSVQDMAYMFSYAYKFNGNVSNWNVSKVQDMKYMFYKAENFNQDISNWNISNVYYMLDMLTNTSFNTENYNALLSRWSSLVGIKQNVLFGVSPTKYSVGYQNERNILTGSTYKWGITDGGSVANPPTTISLNFTSSVSEYTIYIRGTNININLIADGTSSVYLSNQQYDIKTEITIISDNFTSINIEGTISEFGEINKHIYSPDNVTMILYNNIILNNAFNNCMNLMSVNITGTKFITSAIKMFYNALVFNHDISNWDIQNVTNMTDMLVNTSFSTDNYNKLLAGWSTIIVKPNVVLGVGTTKYNIEYEDDKLKLTNYSSTNWTINDGGIITNIQTIQLNFDNAVYNYYMYVKGTNISVYRLPLNSITWYLQKKYTTELEKTLTYIYIEDSSLISGLKIEGTITEFGGVDYKFSYSPSSVNMYLLNNISLNNAFYNYMNLTSVSVTGSEFITSALGMFYNALIFNQDISSWNIINVTDMTDMLVSTSFNTNNYHLLLKKWSALLVKTNVNFSAGSTKYESDCLDARNILTGTYKWIITDGGQN